MVVQFYKDDPVLVRVFEGNWAIMDCHLPIDMGKDLKSAKVAVSRCNLKIKSKWEKTYWGYEARCSFK